MHLQPLREVTTHSLVMHELISQVSGAFNTVVDAAISHIVRVVFSDLDDALLSFESLWEEERVSGTACFSCLSSVVLHVLSMWARH